MRGRTAMPELRSHATLPIVRTHPRPANLRGQPARAGAVSLRVRYCECDPMGVAHHAAYVPWLEVARTELLRDSGVTYAHLEHEGVFLVITAMDCKYRRPIFYDDLIELRTKVVGVSHVKITHEYEIVLLEDGGHGQNRVGSEHREMFIQTGESLAIASTTLACVDKSGKIRALPEWLAAE